MNKKKRLKKELNRIFQKYHGTLDWLEEGELKSWVESGNSPYSNPDDVIHADGSPFDFIEWHRSARWICELPLNEHNDREEDDILFHYYTDLGHMPFPAEEKQSYYQSAQIFLCNEISFLRNYIQYKNLLEDYMSFRYPSPDEEELPFA